jgi:hypothetical protein
MNEVRKMGLIFREPAMIILLMSSIELNTPKGALKTALALFLLPNPAFLSVWDLFHIPYLMVYYSARFSFIVLLPRLPSYV